MDIHLTLQDTSSGKSEEIVVSTEHPFYVDGKGFIPAEQLGTGSQIVSRAGPRLTLKGVRREMNPSGITLYNLTVATDHTYFVGAVDGGAWAHNDSCWAIASDLRDELGGEVWVLEPNLGAKWIFSADMSTRWGVHAVHVIDDMVRDPMTLGSLTPMPVGDWLKLWYGLDDNMLRFSVATDDIIAKEMVGF